MDNDFLSSRNEKEANMMVNSDKSGIVASINSSVKLAKTKDRDSKSDNRVTKFSSDCVKNVCHLKKWTPGDVYRMVDGLILHQVTIQDVEKLQLDNACFLYPNIRHELKTKWTRWLELNCSCSLWSQYFLPVGRRVIFAFLLSAFLSGQNYGQNNIHWSNVWIQKVIIR